MNNLFKPKSKIYQKKFSEQRVYQQDMFYLLKVEDRAGIIEEKGGDEFMNELFEKMQNRSLKRFIYNEIDERHYDISVKSCERGRDYVVKVSIDKRPVSKEVKRFWSKIFKKIIRKS